MYGYAGKVIEVNLATGDIGRAYLTARTQELAQIFNAAAVCVFNAVSNRSPTGLAFSLSVAS